MLSVSASFFSINAHATTEATFEQETATDVKTNKQIDEKSLAKFITTKFKLLVTLKKESKIYLALHEELFGNNGLVEAYMELTDYDFDQMNRLYASAGGLVNLN